MPTAELQQYINSKPSGLPTVFQGDNYLAVTEEVMLDLIMTADVSFVVSVMLKWFGGKDYADRLGAFVITEYDGPVGTWYTWTYRE
jgi:hypothetical protein